MQRSLLGFLGASSITLALFACGSSVQIGGAPGQGGSTAEGTGGGPDDPGFGGDVAQDAPEPCPTCPRTGWPCGGPENTCCDGEACLEAEGGGWFCGGVRADGQDSGCTSGGEGCFWVEPNVCPDLGPIEGICGPGASVVQLQRCNGSCFIPDALYQTHFIRGCDAATATDDCAATGICGPIWQAALCCP